MSKKGPPLPDLNVRKLAKELKAYLDAKKLDLVDPERAKIEAWPDPKDDKYPEMKSFAAQWEAFFDYADTVTGPNGEGFPHEAVAEFEAKLEEAEELVNSDAAFWDRIRAEVLPLYKKTTFVRGENGAVSSREQDLAGAWKDRWKRMHVFYDPVSMDVKTTKMMTNKRTGVRTPVEVISERTLPQGFVIQVDPKKES